jgi:hypothetical protein
LFILLQYRISQKVFAIKETRHTKTIVRVTNELVSIIIRVTNRTDTELIVLSNKSLGEIGGLIHLEKIAEGVSEGK